VPGGAYDQGQAQARLNAQAKNGLGVAALICGLVGVTVVPVLASIAAVVLGHMGLSAHKEGQADNHGMSLAGMILGYVGVALGVLAIIAIVVFLGFFATMIDKVDPSFWEAASVLL